MLFRSHDEQTRTGETAASFRTDRGDEAERLAGIDRVDRTPLLIDNMQVVNVQRPISAPIGPGAFTSTRFLAYPPWSFLQLPRPSAFARNHLGRQSCRDRVWQSVSISVVAY